MSTTDEKLVLRSIADALGAVPYLLGFHPRDSVVAVFINAGRVQVVGRADLADSTSAIIEQFRAMAGHQRADAIIVVGYGPQEAASIVSGVAAAMAPGVATLMAVLVTDDQYFCLKPDCVCPAVVGVPFDPKATQAAAQFTMQGVIAMPSREDLLAAVTPDPAAQAAVGAAISALTVQDGFDVPTLAELMTLAQHGTRLTDAQVAQITVILTSRAERDAAWAATTNQVWQRDLWLDVTRRVPTAYSHAPACLAAWCTWLRGEGPLAVTAAQRALDVDPRNTLGKLIFWVVKSQVDPRDVLKNWPPAPTNDVADAVRR